MASGVKGTIEHGTRAMYQKGCRCQECKSAQARGAHEYREKRKAQGAQNPELIPHGTYSGYITWCCRCEECSTVHREYQRERARNGKIKRTRWASYTAARQKAQRRERDKGGSV